MIRYVIYYPNNYRYFVLDKKGDFSGYLKDALQFPTYTQAMDIIEKKKLYYCFIMEIEAPKE